MRFVSFQFGGTEGWGLVEADEVAVLTGWHPSLLDAIVRNDLAAAPQHVASAPRAALRDLVFRPLLPNPGKILCVGLNYEKHRQETGRAVVAHPTIFTRFADSQTAHEAPILMPLVSDKLDFEGELAVVIGKGGRSIAAERALDHVAGYSCYNDGSVRDWQAHTIQFTPGKNFPGTGSFGPWLVTPEEFGPIGPQRIQTRLNGQVMQDARLSEMIFSVARIIEYCSTFTPLSPGDVIVSGTPGGVGAKRDPQVFMRVGDEVEVEIDGIGTLVNGIARAA